MNNHTYSLTAAASQSVIGVGGSVTVTGVLTKDGNNWASQTVTLYDGATVIDTVTTDSNGAYSKTVTGLNLGAHSLKAIHTNAESSTVIVTVCDALTATFSGDSVSLGYSSHILFYSTTDVLVDWGDGSTTVLSPNPRDPLSHSYTDGENSHTIQIIGAITQLGYGAFNACTNLTSVVIPEGVTILTSYCFRYCQALPSVVIPEGVESLGDCCFQSCDVLRSVTIPASVTSIGDIIML